MIEKEALKLHSDLVIPDIAALEESKGKSKDKRENILIIWNHFLLVFIHTTKMCLNQNCGKNKTEKTKV